MGFNEYLTRVRLEKAKQLLRGYDLKVKEIAHNCGFVDSNYFCRVLNATQNARHRSIGDTAVARSRPNLPHR